MSISIKDVVAITGSPGLYQIVKADDKAIIVESIDEQKKRQLIKGNMMVSKLIDVSIYTNDESEPLVNVLKLIQEKFGESLPVHKKSNKSELMSFLGEVLPEYDAERVYPSNVKKMVAWYSIIREYNIDLDIAEEEENDEVESPSEKEEPSASKPATEEQEENTAISSESIQTPDKDKKTEETEAKKTPEEKTEVEEAKTTPKKQNTEKAAPKKAKPDSTEKPSPKQPKASDSSKPKKPVKKEEGDEGETGSPKPQKTRKKKSES